MKFKRCRYRIHDRDFGSREVIGYAVRQGLLPDVRLAVRHVAIAGGGWKCDHWDTGFFVTWGITRNDAVHEALYLILEKMRTGEYERQVADAQSRGWLPPPRVEGVNT